MSLSPHAARQPPRLRAARAVGGRRGIGLGARPRQLSARISATMNVSSTISRWAVGLPPTAPQSATPPRGSGDAGRVISSVAERLASPGRVAAPRTCEQLSLPQPRCSIVRRRSSSAGRVLRGGSEQCHVPFYKGRLTSFGSICAHRRFAIRPKRFWPSCHSLQPHSSEGNPTIALEWRRRSRRWIRTSA